MKLLDEGGGAFAGRTPLAEQRTPPTNSKPIFDMCLAAIKLHNKSLQNSVV